MDSRTEAPISAPILDARAVVVVARYEGTTLTLDVRGEADIDTAESLRADLVSALRPGLRSAHLDLTNLSFCDLRGSDALHAFVDEARSLGISVDLHGMSPLLAHIYAEFSPRWQTAAVENGFTLR